MAEVAAHEAEEGDSEDEEHSDDDGEEDEEEVEEEEATTAESDERIPVVEPTEDPPSLDTLAISKDAPTEEDDENENEDDSASDSDVSSTFSSDRETLADAGSHRRHRPSKRLAPKKPVDVEQIVADKLRRTKASTERRHHGKKTATANVLGRQKGSKKKQDPRRAIKDANTF